eukprot:symbB.v1.2.006856.t1/scaffold408.1/size210514/14
MVRHVNLHISLDVLQNPRGLGICIAALVVILGVLASHLSMAVQQGFTFAFVYVGWILLGLLLHALTQAIPGGRLHVHHWYWAFLASHYPIFDCLLSSLSQAGYSAAFMGIYVHGVACFGLEAIYEPHLDWILRQVDVLVLNAGVMRRSREFSEDGSEEGNIDVGLVGSWLLNFYPKYL